MFNISNNYGNINYEDKGRFLMNELKINDILHENIELIEGLGLINTIQIDNNGYFISSNNIQDANTGIWSDNIPTMLRINLTNQNSSLVLQNRIQQIIEVGINLLIIFDNLVKSFIKKSKNIDEGIKKSLEVVKENFKIIIKNRKLDIPTVEEKFKIRTILLDKKDIDMFISKLNYKSII